MTRCVLRAPTERTRRIAPLRPAPCPVFPSPGSRLMAIDVRELSTRVLDPLIAEELDIYERTVGEYLDGRIDEDVFRVFRLNHGVYGQRQGGHNQMLRIKIPYGKVTPE